MKLNFNARLHFSNVEWLILSSSSAKALADTESYACIVEQRKTFSKIQEVDFANHTPDKTTIPPAEIIDVWAKRL